MILVFGGTTEGRLAADVIDAAGKPWWYSTLTPAQDIQLAHGHRLSGAMTAADTAAFCQANGVKLIVNAAHPFAEGLHAELAKLQLPIVRIEREAAPEMEGVTWCSSFAEAVEKMHDVGHLLALSGANTIPRLRPHWTHRRTTFRILRREESQAKAHGLPVVYFRDDLRLPTADEERELMQRLACDAIITKESGTTGGLVAKVEAARSLGIKVFVVRRPALPKHWIYVTGRHTLRRAIEQRVPGFYPLRTGFTTGLCATAASKAAALSLIEPHLSPLPDEVQLNLPDGECVSVPVEVCRPGVATETNDFSDVPDVTRGCRSTAQVKPTAEGGIRFSRGEGVGKVTLPGLGLPVGEPAINPTPRRMIEQEISPLLPNAEVTISVEGGEELAKRTFNPKVGVVDGISIIGTTGIVSPLSHEAFIESIGRELQVARAIGCEEIAIAGGRRGEEAVAQREPLRCIHYGNHVGATLQKAHAMGFRRVVVAIMIGKAVKLAEGHLDTHSHRATMNVEFLRSLGWPLPPEPFMARELWRTMPQAFFYRISQLCYTHCRRAFPDGQLEIMLVCDAERS